MYLNVKIVTFISDVALQSSPVNIRMHMISTDFFKVAELFLGGAGHLPSTLFGLRNFSETELLHCDFELVGDPLSFHFFEKAYQAPYFRRKVTVVLKQYFFGAERLGCGLSIVGKARLNTVLKGLASKQYSADASGELINLYFSEDKREGAVIIAPGFVIRFNQWSTRDSYKISTLECDFRDGRFGDIAKKAVFEAYKPIDLGSMKSEGRAIGCSNALKGLIRTISDYPRLG